jgi:hypothetical protein
MDQFNKLYNMLIEHLTADILAPNNGSTGGALENTDSYATANMQRPFVIGKYTRKGNIRSRKPEKKK